MAKIRSLREARQRRHRRVRAKLSGTPERPRLTVFRSLDHIYAQVIDDAHGNTIVAASTLEPEVRTKLDGTNKTREAQMVGQLVAQRARERGVGKVVFDRGGYLYHGRIKALADAAREAGLEF